VSPVRAADRGRYPADWPQISVAIRFGRAGGQCECAGECGTGHAGRCEARRYGASARAVARGAGYRRYPGGTAEPEARAADQMRALTVQGPAVPSANCPAAGADSHQADERTPS